MSGQGQGAQALRVRQQGLGSDDRHAGIIVAALAHAQNEYNGHTLPEVLEWTEAITGHRPQWAIVDRGYRGRQTVGTTEILMPGRPAKNQILARTQQLRRWFRRRAAIEPVISHLRHHFRLGWCFLKGAVGAALNETNANTRQLTRLFGNRYLRNTDLRNNELLSSQTLPIRLETLAAY